MLKCYSAKQRKSWRIQCAVILPNTIVSTLWGHTPLLTTHTELASAGAKNHVPFAAVAAANSRYIPAECLPLDVCMRDPRNMTKQAITQFFTHIRDRQDLHGPEHAFRFSHFNGRRGVRQVALYGETGSDSNAGQMRPRHCHPEVLKERHLLRQVPTQKAWTASQQHSN